MKGRKRGQRLDRGKHIIVDERRTGEVVAAVDNALTDRLQPPHGEMTGKARERLFDQHWRRRFRR